MPHAGLPGEHRRGLAIDHQRCRRHEHVGRRGIDAVLSDHHDVIHLRLVSLVVVDDQHRTVEPERQLSLVVKVRVVDERAAARRRESHHEGGIGLDHRRQLALAAAPVVHAVVVGVELHSMPVHRGGLAEAVHHRDLHWFSAFQHERRPWYGCRSERGRNPVAAEAETEARLIAGGAALHRERHPAGNGRGRGRRLGSRVRGIENPDTEDHSGHPGRGVVASVRLIGRGRSTQPSLGRDVMHQMTMKQPVAGPLRSPRHRHRRCRREEVRHDRMPIGGSDRSVSRSVADAVHLEVEAVQVHGMRLRAQVDHTPACRLADVIRQTLGRRP